MRRLKPQHKVFAAAVIAGMSQTQAYLKAYPQSTEDAARCNASRLIASDNVRDYIERAKEKAITASILTRAERLELLSSLAKGEETFPKDKIAAVKVLNDMTGDNAPQKLEHSGTISLLSVVQRIQRGRV